MPRATDTTDRYTWHPLTAARWGDLETLFGPRGACNGCWCMYYQYTHEEFHAGCRDNGARNREALHAITVRGDVLGILAYEGDEPVGWCSVAPRDKLPTLDRSRRFKRLDDTPIWSIVCFYVGRGHRGRGVMTFLVDAAVAYVREQGGSVIEAYPRCGDERLDPVNGWVGLLPVFTAAGFVEAARPSRVRAIVRYDISHEKEQAVHERHYEQSAASR